MKLFYSILFLIVSCSLLTGRKKDLSDPSNVLSGKTQSLELHYIVWGCACANWVTPENLEKYKDLNLDEYCIFIEPERPDLDLPIYFDPFRHYIKVTGQFYERPDYPKGTPETEEQLDKAPVFRYSQLEVKHRESAYSPKDDTTMIFSYQAIACTCAQWSDTQPVSDSTKAYYYLEPADSTLVKADTLFNGRHLPVQVEVRGQLVSEYGYPMGFSPAKGEARPAPVFRYTAIKTLQNGPAKKRS